MVRLWTVIAVCGVVSGVHAQARPVTSALIGVWAVREASGRVSTLKFSGDGFFEVEFLGDEGPDVTGRYKVVRNELIMTDESGPAACLAPAYAPARYAFTIRADELTLDAVKDDCDGRLMILERRAALMRSWTKRK